MFLSTIFAAIIFLFSTTPVFADDPQIIISALNPSGDWLEIENLSTEKIDLRNWFLSDIGNHKIPLFNGTINCINPGKYRIINEFPLNNSDTETLFLSIGTSQISTYSYTTSSPTKTLVYDLNSSSFVENESYVKKTDDTCFIVPDTPTPTPISPVPTQPQQSPSPTVPTNTPAPTSTPKPSTTIIIESFPSLAHVQQAFSIRFRIENLTPNTQYTFKGIGGVNGLESLETYSAGKWYGYTGAWDSHPKYTSDSSGKINQSISMRVKSSEPAGEYKVQIRNKELSQDSDIKYITIKAKLPTSTTAPSVSPTPSDEPTPTQEFLEDNTPTPIPTDIPEISLLSSSDSDNILGVTSPASSQKSKSVPLPFLFMAAGGIFLLAPLVITYLARVKKSH